LTELGLRLGAIYPDDILVDDDIRPLLAEWGSYLPAGVQMVSAHHFMPLADITLDIAIEMAEDPTIETAALRLMRHKPTVLGYYCTTASFIRGLGGDTDIINRIEGATGIPATTTTTAAVKALHALGLKRVAVTSPYLEEVHQALLRFLQASGFEVVSTSALNIPQNQALTTPEEIRAAAEKVDVPEADGVSSAVLG